jgi:glutamine amidotransferase
MIAIIDLDLGNVGAVKNMLGKIGADALITNNVDEIDKADKLILPGVGTFDTGMNSIRQFELSEVLSNAVLDRKTPVLGICLGMQLFAKKSEEGTADGLNWIDARIVKFSFRETQGKLKIPHMGWSEISVSKNSNLIDEQKEPPRFYFVHSYYMECADVNDILATTDYGYPVVAAIERDNILGVQFHPEKSHRFGMNLLKRFVEYY